MADTPPSSTALARAFKQARKAVLGDAKSKDEIYNIPTYVAVGASGSSKGTLLGQTRDPNAERHTFNLEDRHDTRFWIYRGGMIFEASGGYFSESEGPAQPPTKTSWFRRLKQKFGKKPEGHWAGALDAIAKNRPRRPLDGVIMCVDAGELLRSGAAVSGERRNAGEEMAERLHAAQDKLGIQFPVYLVLTGSEALEGFAPFARALPGALREKMFGWSSPASRDRGYADTWVDDCVDALEESVGFTQLQLLRHADSQRDRDALYLFPRSLGTLRDPLQRYLEPIFKPSVYRRPLALRGIYLTGDIADREDDPAAAAEYAFVKEVFDEKVFNEKGLTQPDPDRMNKASKSLRIARLGFAAGVLALTIALVVQWRITAGRVEDFSATALPILNEARVSQDYVSQAEMNQRPQRVLKALAKLRTERFTYTTSPGTLIDELERNVKTGIGRLLGKWVAQPLRNRLVTAAEEALRPIDLGSNGTELGAIGDVLGFARAVVDVEVARVSQFVTEVAQLQKDFDHYSNPSPETYGKLYDRLYNPEKKIAGDLGQRAGLYRSAFELYSSETAPKLLWDEVNEGEHKTYRERSVGKFDQLARGFRRRVFESNDENGRVTRQVETIVRRGNTIDVLGPNETLNSRFSEIKKALDALDAIFKRDPMKWLWGPNFSPSESYVGLVREPLRDFFGEQAGDRAQAFAEENDKELSTFRDNLIGYRAKHGDFAVLDLSAAGLALSEGSRRLLDGIDEFQHQSYTSQNEPEFSHRQSAEWVWDLLDQIPPLTEQFYSYVRRPPTEFPAGLAEHFQTAARQELWARVVKVLEFAAPSTTSDQAGWAAQRSARLKERIAHVRDQTENITKIVAVLDELSQSLDVANVGFHGNIIEYAEGLLRQTDDVLTQAKLYQLDDARTDWWTSDQPPGVAAFGARDADDLANRLKVQHAEIEDLAFSYAAPLVDLMLLLDESNSRRKPIVKKWKDIIDILHDYQKKVPGNALDELQRFVEIDLNKVRVSTCRQQLRGSDLRASTANFFEERQYFILTAMLEQCDRLRRVTALTGYSELQEYFDNQLSGRFPFALPEVQEEADPDVIVAFYRKFDRYAEMFEALLRPQRPSDVPNGLYGDVTPSVLQFLRQMHSLRPVFAQLLSGEGAGAGELNFETQWSFRINRDNELNGNQIIDWWSEVGDTTIQYRANRKTIPLMGRSSCKS